MSSIGLVLQIDSVRTVTEMIYDRLGLGWFVDTYGALPAFGLLLGVIVIGWGLVTVGRSHIGGVGGGSSGGIDGQGRDVDDDLVAEAARRLQRSDDEITSEALQAELADVEDDAGGDPDAARLGLTRDGTERSEAAKVSVAPDRLIESESFVKRRGEFGEKYARNMILSSYPSRVAPGWLDAFFTSGLSTNDAEVRTSFHLFPRDAETMKRKLDVRATRLTAQLKRKQEEGKLNTTEEEQKLQHVNRLRDGLTKGSTKLFDFAVYFEVLADDEETLNEATQEVKQLLSQSNARATTLYDRQRQAMQSVAPLATDPVRNTQIMDLEALGTTFPFTDTSVVEATGVLMGFHMATNTPVVVDRFEQSGHNMLISGKIGSGKSYLAKLTMWRRLMMDPETEVLIIDPVGGFGDVVDAVEGQRITIDRHSIINPLEIKQVEEGEATEGDPYDDKIRSVMGIFEAHFQGKREMSKEEEGVLRRAIRYAYLEQGITKDVDTHDRESPTIQTVLDILESMAEGEPPNQFLDVPAAVEAHITTINTETEVGEAEQDRARRQANRIADYAHSILLGLEDFRHGGQHANLNGETNVELQDRVVQFDLSSVADGSNEGIIMQIVLDWLFQRAKSNTGKMIVMIDEAHYMLGHEQALDMLNLFARHSRHYGSGLTLISQTVDEFMNHPKAKEIYDQCDIRALMRHQDIGEDAIDALDLTERERDFVLQAQAGNSAAYSESLLYVTSVGKMRMRVLSNDFEHHVIDGDLNVWAFLYDNEMVPWKRIPDHEQGRVREVLDMGPPESALSD